MKVNIIVKSEKRHIMRQKAIIIMFSTTQWVRQRKKWLLVIFIEITCETRTINASDKIF